MQEWQEKIEQEYKRLEAEQRDLRAEVKRLKEQQTEPIKVTRIELDPTGIINQLNQIAQTQADHGERFDTLKVELKQEFHTVSDSWLDTLQEHYTEHNNRFDQLQGNITEIKGLLQQLVQQKGSQ